MTAIINRLKKLEKSFSMQNTSIVDVVILDLSSKIAYMSNRKNMTINDYEQAKEKGLLSSKVEIIDDI